MKKQLYELDEAIQILILFWTPTNTQLVIELQSSLQFTKSKSSLMAVKYFVGWLNTLFYVGLD